MTSRVLDTAKQPVRPMPATPALGHSPMAATVLQSAGNFAMQNLGGSPFLQAKLGVGLPSDPFEEEADRIAGMVAPLQSSTPDQAPCSCSDSAEHKCDACRQREAKQQVQRKTTAASQLTEAPPLVDEVLRSAGHPMDESTRQGMESGIGADFSRVRIHTGPAAAESAGAIQARAYTSGTDIVFGAGQYSPDSRAGQHLLAHELTHVVQQGGSRNGIQRDVEYINVEIIQSVDEYTPPGSNWTHRVGEALSYSILMDIVLQDHRALFKWFNFEAGVGVTGSWADWEFYAMAEIAGSHPEIKKLARQFSPQQWRAMWPNPAPTIMKLFEEGKVTLEDEAVLATYRGMIRSSARQRLDENEKQIDDLLGAADKVAKLEEYTQGLKEASIIRDQLQAAVAQADEDVQRYDKSFVAQQGFTFGLPKLEVNLDPYRQIRMAQEKALAVERRNQRQQVLEMWIVSFPLLSRLTTNQISPGRVEATLQEIKSNIIEVRGYIDRNKMDPWDFSVVREQLASGLGPKAKAIVGDEDTSKKHWGWAKMIGGAIVGIGLLFVPGGAFIDMAIGVSMAVDAWDEAEKIGHAANTGLHVDEGLMSQGQAQMAKIMAVVSTVLGAAGVAASSFRILRIGSRFLQASKALPELAAAERMALARALASEPGVLETLAEHAGDDLVMGRMRTALRELAENPKALGKALEGLSEFTKLRRLESDVLKDAVEHISIENGAHHIRIDKSGRIWICSDFCTDTTGIALKVLGGHKNLRANADVVRLIQNLADGGMDVDLMAEIVKAVAADKKGIANTILMLARLQAAEKAGVTGIKVVLSDLAQGGGKGQGARLVLDFIEGTKNWDKVTALEFLEDAGELGGRRYDAIIGGLRYQFKDWGRFSGSTFLEQIKKDLAVTSLENLQWVFRAGRIGTAKQIIALAKKVLLKAAKDDKDFAAAAKMIIDHLDDIVKVY